MKNNKRIILIVIMVLAALVMTLGFVGCKSEFLKMPILTYYSESNSVGWNTVENANEYQVSVYKGEKADKQLKIYSTTQTRKTIILDDFSGIITVGVSCLATSNYRASSQKLISINVDQKCLVGEEINNKEDNSDGELVIDGKVVNSLTNIYFSKATKADIKIKVQKDISQVDAYEIKPTHWSYDKADKILTLKASYFNMFNVGAKVKFQSYSDGNPTTVFYVQVANALPYELRGASSVSVSYLEYTKTDENILGLTVRVYDFENSTAGNEIYLHGNKVKRVVIDDSAIPFDNMTTGIVIKEEYLDRLSVGEHKLLVFTDLGKSEKKLIIHSKIDFAPSNVRIDIETAYPYALLRWDNYNLSLSQITDIRVVAKEEVLGSKSYSINDPKYRKLFEGDSFDLSVVLTHDSIYNVHVEYQVGDKTYSSDSIEYNKEIDNSLVKYLLQKRDYLGKDINTYLSSNEEVKEIIFWAILNYDKLAEWGNTVSNDSTSRIYEKKLELYYKGSNDKLMQLITAARNSFPEAVSWSALLTYKEKKPYEFTLYLSMRSTLYPSLITQDTTCNQEELNNDIYVGSGQRMRDYESSDKVPFNIMISRDYAVVSSTTQLYMAIEKGKRPLPEEGSPAERIYKKAKDVLYQIIDDKMDEYQKVAAIYSWLGDQIIYDYKVASLASSIPTSDSRYDALYRNSAFFAEGVFDNKLAVCNGIAQALVIMCGIEGIKAYKIQGDSDGGAHAWNKVYIDNSWYIVDATWANKGIDTKGDNIADIEVLSYNTLFMTTESSGALTKHVESPYSDYLNIYAGECNYNFFANFFYLDKASSFSGSGEQERVNDRLFETETDATEFLEIKALQFENQKSFVLNILVNKATGIVANQKQFVCPSGWEMTHLAKHKGNFLIEKNGQNYQYGKEIYMLYIIKFTNLSIT